MSLICAVCCCWREFHKMRCDLQLRGRLPPGVDGWGVSLRGLMSMVVVGGLLVAGTYFWLQRTVVPGVVAKLPPKPKKHKAEMGIGESFTFLAKSTYIRDLATLVRRRAVAAAAFLCFCAPAMELRLAAGMQRTRVNVSWASCRCAHMAVLNFTTGGCVRHQHQPGGGDMEEQDQAAVPQPQRLFPVHGQLLHRHRHRNLPDDAAVALHLPQVRLGRRRRHHPHRAAHHRWVSHDCCAAVAAVCPCIKLTSTQLQYGCTEHCAGPTSFCSSGKPCLLKLYLCACCNANTESSSAGVMFFSLVLFGAPLDPMLASFGLTPLMAAVIVGAAQNVFSKSSKYSLFDPCKEMAYIPLDQETQVCHFCKIRHLLPHLQSLSTAGSQ